MKLAAIALLLSQLSYGPFASGPRDHSFAVGVAPHGMLVAWSEIPPGGTHAAIHTATIDFDGRWMTPVRALAPFNSDSHVTSPQIATDGEQFFVVWVERDSSSWLPSRIAGTLVDGNGLQRGNTLFLGRASDGGPAIVWNGLAFQVYGQASHSVTTHGAATRLASEPVARRVPFATPEANGWVEWFDGRTLPCYMGPGCGGDRVRLTYTLRWAVVSSNWIRTGEFGEQGYHGGRPAVLAKDDDLLVIWRAGRVLHAMPVVDARAQRAFHLTLPHDASEPMAAESLVVYEAGDNIYGVPIVDGKRFGEPFAITTAAEFESLPRVYLVGPDRYLVTWVVDRIPAQTHLRGTFVILPR